jgi:glutamate synthase domain-containing protein 3
MTGGLAFVFDEDDRASAHINSQLVLVESPTPFEIEYLHQWITRHAQLTSSEKAQSLLRDWHANAGRFLKITPKDQAAQAQPIAMVPATATESVLVERGIGK